MICLKYECHSGERLVSRGKTGEKREADACKEVTVVLKEENVLIFKTLFC